MWRPHGLCRPRSKRFCCALYSEPCYNYRKLFLFSVTLLGFQCEMTFCAHFMCESDMWRKDLQKTHKKKKKKRSNKYIQNICGVIVIELSGTILINTIKEEEIYFWEEKKVLLTLFVVTCLFIVYVFVNKAYNHNHVSVVSTVNEKGDAIKKGFIPVLDSRWTRIHSLVAISLKARNLISKWFCQVCP